jgi:hypothetical protein
MQKSDTTGERIPSSLSLSLSLCVCLCACVCLRVCASDFLHLHRCRQMNYLAEHLPLREALASQRIHTHMHTNKALQLTISFS